MLQESQRAPADGAGNEQQAPSAGALWDSCNIVVGHRGFLQIWLFGQRAVAELAADKWDGGAADGGGESTKPPPSARARLTSSSKVRALRSASRRSCTSCCVCAVSTLR